MNSSICSALRPFSVEPSMLPKTVPAGGNVTVLSNGLWQRRFGSDPAIVGKTLSLGGEPYTVIGVLAPTFTFDPPADLYLPFQADPNSTNQGHYFQAAARLKRGVSLSAAQAALNLAGQEFKRRYPQAARPQGQLYRRTHAAASGS